METKIKNTVLHDWHMANGANMADFGGYHMPLWYPSGVKKEHLAILTNAGIFDTSHMALVTIAGPDAFNLLQVCFSRDLNACVGKNKNPLEPGKCVYGVYLNEQGHVIDDAIVYQLESESYMVVVNAGMGAEITQHMNSHINGQNVQLTDLADKVGKMDIQGPLAAKVLMKILENPEQVFKDMRYFTFKGHFDNTSSLADAAVRLKDGTPILLSRTGYTGEFGFEMFVVPEYLTTLWEKILDAGKDEGVIPCGLGARDSLRAGAVLPLSHQDIGAWPFINHPWEFALSYNNDKTGFTKKFIGDEALLNADKSEYIYPFAGYDLRKVAGDAPALVMDTETNSAIGKVLTCVSDMGIGRHNDRIYSISSPDKPENFKPKGLSCGFVKVSTKLVPGQILELNDKRRKIKIVIVDNIRPNRTALGSIKNFM
ncbi:MAG: aminomethyl transferase family protein [Desulfobacteraceae bacterium]|nr:aminomethyl transferase family protein [Desulfobacteraceae bacterium]